MSTNGNDSGTTTTTTTTYIATDSRGLLVHPSPVTRTPPSMWSSAVARHNEESPPPPPTVSALPDTTTSFSSSSTAFGRGTRDVFAEEDTLHNRVTEVTNHHNGVDGDGGAHYPPRFSTTATGSSAFPVAMDRDGGFGEEEGMHKNPLLWLRGLKPVCCGTRTVPGVAAQAVLLSPSGPLVIHVQFEKTVTTDFASIFPPMASGSSSSPPPPSMLAGVAPPLWFPAQDATGVVVPASTSGGDPGRWGGEGGQPVPAMEPPLPHSPSSRRSSTASSSHATQVSGRGTGCNTPNPLHASSSTTTTVTAATPTPNTEPTSAWRGTAAAAAGWSVTSTATQQQQPPRPPPATSFSSSSTSPLPPSTSLATVGTGSTTLHHHYQSDPSPPAPRTQQMTTTTTSDAMLPQCVYALVSGEAAVAPPPPPTTGCGLLSGDAAGSSVFPTNNHAMQRRRAAAVGSTDSSARYPASSSLLTELVEWLVHLLRCPQPVLLVEWHLDKPTATEVGEDGRRSGGLNTAESDVSAGAFGTGAHSQTKRASTVLQLLDAYDEAMAQRAAAAAYHSAQFSTLHDQPPQSGVAGRDRYAFYDERNGPLPTPSLDPLFFSPPTVPDASLRDVMAEAIRSLQYCPATCYNDGRERPLVLARGLEVVVETEVGVADDTVITSLQYRSSAPLR